MSKAEMNLKSLEFEVKTERSFDEIVGLITGEGVVGVGGSPYLAVKWVFTPLS